MSLPTKNPAPGRLSGLRHTAAMVTSAVISGAWVTLAAAQDHAAAAGGPPDQIDVLGQRQDAYRVGQTSTATKTLTPLLDIPQSITMVTRDLIRDQAMQSMGDVVRYVPGVQMAQGEGHRDAPILRGNTSTADFFINGMRDDVQYYRDLYNVERVEVLKGPSGMIFGRGGSGGLINRVPRQADWADSRELWDHARLLAKPPDHGRLRTSDQRFSGIPRHGVVRRFRKLSRLR